MPPRTRAEDERLIAAYHEAALRIQRTLGDLTPRNKRVVLRRVDSIVAELDGLTAGYLQEALPLHFTDGSDEALVQLRAALGSNAGATASVIELADGTTVRVPTGFLYHATPAGNVASIDRTGLQPRVSRLDEGGAASGRVYLALNPAVAGSGLEMNKDGTKLVRVPAGEVTGARLDPHIPGELSVYVTEPIPPEHIEVQTEKGRWRPLREPAIDGTFGVIHTQALKALSEDAKLKFANTLEGVRRGARSAVSAAAKQHVIGKLLVAEIEGASNPAKLVSDAFKEQEITAFQGKNRAWTLEDYAAMLTHTVLAEAHNTGAATRYATSGVQFVQIIERADAPDRTCQWMRGKVVSLSDPRLLNPFHPNCMGGFVPVVGEIPANPLLTADDPRIPADVRKMLLKRV